MNTAGTTPAPNYERPVDVEPAFATALDRVARANAEVTETIAKIEALL
jgi:hypothetical protein